jgi:hypothetical protein
MKTRTETKHWWLLRFYQPDTGQICWIYKPNSYNEWWATKEAKDATKFNNRSEARNRSKTVRAKCLLKKGFFWEVIKVTEVSEITTTEEFVVSNAPPLYQIARAAFGVRRKNA